MLDSAAIAEMEEARALRSMSGAARMYASAHGGSVEVLETCGGAAIYAGPRALWTQAVALGSRGPVPPREIDAMIEFYESRGVTPRIVLNPYADRAFVRELTSRGFVIDMFEHVLALDLRGFDASAAVVSETATAYTTEWVRPDGALLDEMARAWVRAVETDDQAERFREERLGLAISAVHPSLRFAVARDPGGTIVGVGGVDCDPGMPLAMLFAGGVDRAHQRRGLQRRLMLERIVHAKQTGCDAVAVGSRAGLATERNALRLGFRVMYTKVEVVKPTEGLAEPL